MVTFPVIMKQILFETCLQKLFGLIKAAFKNIPSVKNRKKFGLTTSNLVRNTLGTSTKSWYYIIKKKFTNNFGIFLFKTSSTLIKFEIN